MPDRPLRRFGAVALLLILVLPTKSFQRHWRSEVDKDEDEDPAAVVAVVADNDTFFLEFASPETQSRLIGSCGRLILLAADDGSVPIVILIRLLDY